MRIKAAVQHVQPPPRSSGAPSSSTGPWVPMPIGGAPEPFAPAAPFQSKTEHFQVLSRKERLPSLIKHY